VTTHRLVSTAAIGLAVAVLSAALGYYLGTGSLPWLALTHGMGAEVAMKTEAPKEPALPDAVPQMPPAAAAPGTPSPPEERKVLYYRNPMGLPDTSPVPKKDWMGMDYIAVYEGEEKEDKSTVKVSLDRVQRSGVRSEEAKLASLARPVRAPGVAKPDERTLRSITLRFDGYVEKLYANVKGQKVKAGEPLFAVYSPEIQSVAVDYRRQVGTAGARSKEDAAYYAKSVDLRFRNMALPDSAISQLRNTGALPQRIDWPSPASGTVIEKKVVEGQMVKAGEELLRLADLESIWVIANVTEQDLGSVTLGQPAIVTFRALPGQQFAGRVAFVLHELDAATRTAQVRVEVRNPEHKIRHEMYAEVEIDTGAGEKRQLVVPSSAVIDSGERQVVIIDKGEGRFEPRAIVIGQRGEGMVEISKGLAAGEKVVVAANFLIDAESNIKAALEAFAPGPEAVGRSEQGNPGHSPGAPERSPTAAPSGSHTGSHP
jgi:Cu(I)/Ag(I) efflux system membrane fusion protein